ncbi:tetratricopeptide repeat-containing sulfotransferase family protein [Sphingomonas psychrolutea]|uniref:Sulfotransferase n=1 Tax=Sphingomonas psychrolutea TaxID=1259676 RepID=A0ABQ1GFT1_9SPHN|nr:tetratricopeptide repeat-containing sulfotransferase family protein [Sphingomonas psychrolutea]GGA42926.1 sulfotransferase [Sphingomonas psychrolutea]
MDPRSEAARHAIGAGDAVRARALAQGVVDPAEAHFLLGLADALQGRVTVGIGQLDAAIAIAPRAEYLAQKARMLILVRRDGEARVAAEAALAAGPDDALTFDTIGNIHARLGDHQAALRCFEPAVARDGGNLEYRYNLALALGFLGRTVEATAHYEAILARAPRHGRAHYALSGLAKASPTANHIARLEAVLAAASSPDDALRIRYALAKEYDDIGEPQPAFRHLSAANAAHKARTAYDFSSDAAIFDAIETAFRKPDFFSGSSQVTEAPIFITGMPRTGTTLVDRILSSHPQVHSAGELQAMPLAIKQLSGTRSRFVTDPETLFASGALSPDAVGRAYLAHAVQHRRRVDGRFIDKLPANFLHIGHIARALPQASIVCLRRNPMDTVWSNYKNLFATTSAYYAYSHDLLDTARYFARFDRLMTFWETLLPGRILQLRYEDLVADQEQQSRRLFAHCGLDWTDAALGFHTNSAAVATPSAAQVRRPMYRDSVERWRAHEADLAPVRAFFDDAAISV